MKIRADQLKAFEREAWRRFELEMVEHSKSFSPRLTELLGDKQLVAVLREAMVRAWGYGFTNRGPQRLYIELTLLCGSWFDTDPQYAPLGKALRGPEEQMVRAEKIHQGHNRYLAEVTGPQGEHVRTALRSLAEFVLQPLPFSLNDLNAGLHSEIRRIFPGKYEYAGEKWIARLIEEAKAAAEEYGLGDPRHITLIVVLMLAFGHGCTRDPLHPWISNTLQDEGNPTAAGRAECLEKKAMTWLTRVLADDKTGGLA